MTRIVQLTTYPLKAPRHGGQLRCAAIRECYRSLGFEVETVAAIHGSDYRSSDQERNDIVLPADHSCFDPEFARFTDAQSGRLLATDPAIWRAFAALLERLRPDVIALEQPWLYPAVKRWLAERDDAIAPRLIYSSQNIEWRLKRDESGDPAARAEAQMREVARVEALEHEVVRAADLVVACTDEELAELRAMAGDNGGSRIYVTAHNAIAPFAAEPSRIEAVKRRYGLDRYPLFVGSAHPPNADGFWQMLAPSLAFLRPDERIVVAGGVAHYLRQHPVYAAWPAINEPRLAILGELERDDLVALLGGASLILLPITTGGGSNLKTAEAIYSGKPLLATPHALRGYGDAGRWPTLTVAATADAFRRCMRAVLDRPTPDEPANYESIREQVTWRRSLQSLAQAMLALTKVEPPQGGADAPSKIAGTS
jgi:glycosyltransferase involved in cell wall biosynthesis